MDLEAIAAAGVRVVTEAESLREVSRDAGGIVSCRPVGLVEIESAAQLALLIREAGDQRATLAIRGGATTTGGQCLAPAAVVVSLDGLSTVSAPDGDSVRVEGGVRWRAVIDAVLPHGLVPVVIPTELEGTVGGALGVAAQGTGSHSAGASEQCRSFEAVTGNGEHVRCSHSENAELFQSVPGSLGQLAIVTSATLCLKPAPEEIQIRHLRYDTLEAMTADLAALRAFSGFHVQGRCVGALLGRLRGGEASLSIPGWHYVLELVDSGREETSAVLETLHYLEVMASETTTLSRWFDPPERLLPAPQLPGSLRGIRPRLDWILPAGLATAFVQGLLSGLPPEVATGGELSLQPVRSESLPFVPQPAGDDNVRVTLDCRLPTTAGRQLLGLLSRLSTLGRRAGGFRHPGGWLGFSADDWADHFGSEWSRFRAAKEFFDPRRVLNTGVIPFDGELTGS